MLFSCCLKGCRNDQHRHPTDQPDPAAPKQTQPQSLGTGSELGVSIRTVHRYFEMLDELGIPLYSERGPNGGFSLVRGYKMPPLVLSPDEAVAVGLGATLVEEMWGGLYRDAARGALAKLENLLPDDQRRRSPGRALACCSRAAPRGTGLHTGYARNPAEALRETRRVSLTYEALRPCRTHLPGVRPLRAGFPLGALVRSRVLPLAPGTQVVAGGPHPRGENAGEVYDIPAGFDPHAFLDTEEQPAPAILARLRFAPQAAGFVRDASIGWSEYHRAT